MIEKYGAEYTTQSPVLLAKKHATSKQRYGSETFTNREKSIQTNLERYGVKYAGFQDEKSKELSRQTCLKKYGVEYTAQVPEIREKQRLSSYNKPKLYLDDCSVITFDSMPEVYYYFWLKDNNIAFEYNKCYPKTYVDSNGISHKYYFDFHILHNDSYVELKGDHLFNENNEPICVFDSKYNWIDKYNFLVSENVEIIKTSRIESGDLKYIKENFINKHQFDVEFDNEN